MNKRNFDRLIRELDALGYAKDDIEWSENVRAPETAEWFALEAIYVICNSGMKHKVAQTIFERVKAHLALGSPVFSGFKHKGKASAIEAIWAQRSILFEQYMALDSDDQRLAFLGNLPWIGEITKYHLAKNFGVDCVKPDVHLARLAQVYGTTPDALCASLAKKSGYKKRTVDLLLWRGCAYGILDSKTGLFRDDRLRDVS